jgi:hypothetical protein
VRTNGRRGRAPRQERSKADDRSQQHAPLVPQQQYFPTTQTVPIYHYHNTGDNTAANHVTLATVVNASPTIAASFNGYIPSSPPPPTLVSPSLPSSSSPFSSSSGSSSPPQSSFQLMEGSSSRDSSRSPLRKRERRIEHSSSSSYSSQYSLIPFVNTNAAISASSFFPLSPQVVSFCETRIMRAALAMMSPWLADHFVVNYRKGDPRYSWVDTILAHKLAPRLCSYCVSPGMCGT